MNWNNQGGGPWGPKRPNPWGQGPQGGGSGGGRTPDFEDLIKKGQDRLKSFAPGGQFGGRGVGLVALGAVALWLASGLYTVRPDEVGLNLIFGRYVGTTQPGLNYNLPYPIGSVVRPSVTTVNTTEVGFRSNESRTRTGTRDLNEESLMLTGDENIVDIDFAVQWQVNPARAADYVFNIQDPDTSIKAVAESAMREVVGKRNIQAVLTTERGAIESDVKQLMQDVLDSYGAGVVVRLVQLQKVDPPAQVIDAFRDVQAARQDQDRARNEAETYASKVVPEARGEAARIQQEAEAYRERVIAEASGQASRFDQIYAEYKKAPEVTRERMYLETMERILAGSEKTVIDQNGASQQGVVPYLPLGDFQKKPGAPK
ncbi:MAG: FtsH protease activity modulator HflK [Alphaproteobacteria bacterium]|nr:FtsH protease activity modulator HflK [Alphaproteobacteria bacterium]